MGNDPEISIAFKEESPLEESEIKSLTHYILDRENRELTELSIAFVSGEEMTRINQQFHGEEGPTDVLTFHYEDRTGEIVLCPSQLDQQADTFPRPSADECREVLIHGLLHLAGYDHETDEGQHLALQSDYFEAYKEAVAQSQITETN